MKHINETIIETPLDKELESPWKAGGFEISTGPIASLLMRISNQLAELLKDKNGEEN